MGLEFVDLVFRLERAFSIEIEDRDVLQMLGGKTVNDFTAGHIHDYMIWRLRDRWPASRGAIDTDLSCVICGYNLRGLTEDLACPECGTPIQFEAHVWHGVCHVLEESLGAKQESIRRESRLVQDLGASF